MAEGLPRLLFGPKELERNYTVLAQSEGVDASLDLSGLRTFLLDARGAPEQAGRFAAFLPLGPNRTAAWWALAMFEAMQGASGFVVFADVALFSRARLDQIGWCVHRLLPVWPAFPAHAGGRVDMMSVPDGWHSQPLDPTAYPVTAGLGNFAALFGRRVDKPTELEIAPPFGVGETLVGVWEQLKHQQRRERSFFFSQAIRDNRFQMSRLRFDLAVIPQAWGSPNIPRAPAPVLMDQTGFHIPEVLNEPWHAVEDYMWTALEHGFGRPAERPQSANLNSAVLAMTRAWPGRPKVDVLVAVAKASAQLSLSEKDRSDLSNTIDDAFASWVRAPEQIVGKTAEQVAVLLDAYMARDHETMPLPPAFIVGHSLDLGVTFSLSRQTLAKIGITLADTAFFAERATNLVRGHVMGDAWFNADLCRILVDAYRVRQRPEQLRLLINLAGLLPKWPGDYRSVTSRMVGVFCTLAAAGGLKDLNRLRDHWARLVEKGLLEIGEFRHLRAMLLKAEQLAKTNMTADQQVSSDLALPGVLPDLAGLNAMLFDEPKPGAFATSHAVNTG